MPRELVLMLSELAVMLSEFVTISAIFSAIAYDCNIIHSILTDMAFSFAKTLYMFIEII